MIRFDKHWHSIVLSVFAISVLVTLFNQNPAFTAATGSAYSSQPLFDHLLFEQAGKWAIRFLLLSLAMTPLNTVFGLRGAIKFRKPAGLWAFAFAGLHFALYIDSRGYGLAGLNWEMMTTPSFVIMGLIGLLILTSLAVTSNKWAMRRLGKNWKRLHRFVYYAGVLTILHALSAALSGKRASFGGQESSRELLVYFILLISLLTLRVPIVRQGMKKLPQSLRLMLDTLLRLKSGTRIVQ